MKRRGTFLYSAYSVVLAMWSCLLLTPPFIHGGVQAGQEPPSVLQDVRLMRTNTLFGYRVKSPQGEDLGKLEELMIDLEAGRIAYAVLSFGGLWGLGDKLAVVPWEALQVSTTGDKSIRLNVEKEKLQKAPHFERATLPELANRQWGATIHAYYGYPPYWEQKR